MFRSGFIALVSYVTIHQSCCRLSQDREDALFVTNFENIEDNCTNVIIDHKRSLKKDDTLGDIFEHCKSKIKIQDITFICLHDTYVFLKWDLNNDEVIGDAKFLIERLSLNHSSLTNNQWIYQGWSQTTKYKAEGLSKGTAYKFRITPFFRKIQLGDAVTSSFVMTFNDQDLIKPITDIEVKNFSNSQTELEALLVWKPGSNLACQTNILMYEEGSIDHLIETVDGESELKLNVRYRSTYVLTMFSFVGRSESQQVSYMFNTPSCLLVNNYNLSVCAPDAPENIKLSEGCTSFTISWAKPLANPDKYNIRFHCDEIFKNFTVQGNETNFTLTDDLLSHPHAFGYVYFIYVSAVSPAGESEASYAFGHFNCSSKTFKVVHSQNDIASSSIQNLRFKGNCSPSIIWDEPLQYPDYYRINVQSSRFTMNITLPGDKTNFQLDKMEEGNLLINITAFKQGDSINRSNISLTIHCKDGDTSLINPKDRFTAIIGSAPPNKDIIIVIISISVLISVAVLTCLIIYIKAIKNEIDLIPIPEDSCRKDMIFKKFNSSGEHEIEKKSEGNEEGVKETYEINEVIHDKHEVHRDHIRLLQILGEGEFGVVHKAVLLHESSSTYVAVKTLRIEGSLEHKRQLEKEMELMKSVGRHKNIVSLLGCCTKDMMLIVEYCCLGDLRRYLRKASRMKSWAEEAINDQSNKNLLERNAFSNILYEQSDVGKRYLHLSTLDLLSFARQVALGMAYLSENRVVHRDLAARNVLLAEDMTAKIADFGLSRDVYERNIYTKRSSDKLPLRWMALESLLYQVFSTKSDVWSYGILLWEIMTLGICPYPSLQTSEMFKLLQQGHRMERPKHSNQKIYEIMLNCWDAKPQNRSTFSQIVTKLEEIINNESNRPYLDLDASDYKTSLDEDCEIN